MKKRVYRTVTVGQVAVEQVAKAVREQRLVVGVDVAKEDFVAALTLESGEVVETVKWQHPKETNQFILFLKGLPAQRMEVVLEPSGTYGEALKEQLWKVAVAVYEVSTKRVHDAAEVYDGVPSSHDPKCAAIIAKLHRDGASREWKPDDAMTRKTRALIGTLQLYQEQVPPLRGRLEALLAKYWPGITEQLELNSATLLALLIEFGGPAKIAAKSAEAEVLMRRVGGVFLKPESIQEILQSATTSLGVEILLEEEEALKTIAREMQRALKEVRIAQEKLRTLTEDSPVVKNLKPVFGHVTAAVLVCLAGDPTKFQSSSAYVKCLGLNLKVHSSGKHKGKLRISKRGSSIARKYLFLAALRAIRNYPAVAAWYECKVKRDGGVKMKAIVAIMRKLARAACHVARGETFDESKLFDIRRLGITDDKAA